MPWYRMNGAVVHLSFGSKDNRKAPPPCLEKIEGGETCLAMTKFQCDWKMGGGRTCDRHICEEHAVQVAPGKHLCPAHQEAYRKWRAAREEEPNAAKELPRV